MSNKMDYYFLPQTADYILNKGIKDGDRPTVVLKRILWGRDDSASSKPMDSRINNNLNKDLYFVGQEERTMISSLDAHMMSEPDVGRNVEEFHDVFMEVLQTGFINKRITR